MARDYSRRRADVERLMAALQGQTKPLMLTEQGEVVVPNVSETSGELSGTLVTGEANWLEFLAAQPEWQRVVTRDTSGHIVRGPLPLPVLLAYISWGG
jgi:hypothetical protein